MKLETGVIQPDTTALAITLAEELTQDLICAIAPKLITAIEKDIANLNPAIHPFKHEFNVLLLTLVKSVTGLASCPVATPPVV